MRVPLTALAGCVLVGFFGDLGAAELSLTPITDRGRESISLLSREERDADLAIEIRGTHELTPRDLTRIGGYSFRVSPGLYKSTQASIGGRTFVLVPVKRFRFKEAHPEIASPGTFSCNGPYSTFIAVDPASQQVADTLLEYAGGCPGGREITRWGPRFASSQPIDGVRHSGVAQDEAARLEAVAFAEQQSREAKRQREQDIADRPMKTMIGAKLCRENGGFVETAFTEAVNPYGNKVQLRIVDNSHRGEGRLRPGGWQPSIIWDFPENWRLCE